MCCGLLIAASLLEAVLADLLCLGLRCSKLQQATWYQKAAFHALLRLTTSLFALNGMCDSSDQLCYMHMRVLVFSSGYITGLLGAWMPVLRRRVCMLDCFTT